MLLWNPVLHYLNLHLHLSVSFGVLCLITSLVLIHSPFKIILGLILRSSYLIMHSSSYLKTYFYLSMIHFLLWRMKKNRYQYWYQRSRAVFYSVSEQNQILWYGPPLSELPSGFLQILFSFHSLLLFMWHLEWWCKYCQFCETLVI